MACGFHVSVIALSNLCVVGASQVMTAKGLVDQWNQSLEESIVAAKKWNEDVAAALDRGEMSAEAALSAIMPEPQKVVPPGRRWASSFLQQWGWSLLSRGADSQLWLPYDHADMVASRADFRSLLEKEDVHPALILNYDQLWRAAWCASGKLLFKAGPKGQPAQRTKAPRRADKKINMIKHSRRGITDARLSW